MNVNVGRADLRDARCSECGARCVPGQSHLEHNLGWRKKVLMVDACEVAIHGYPGWDFTDRGEPTRITLAIKNGTGKSSGDIDRELDDVAHGKFHSFDKSRSGSPFIGEGEFYDSVWVFQKREDAYAFIKRYGGCAA
jgi:hypothetical protein